MYITVFCEPEGFLISVLFELYNLISVESSAVCMSLISPWKSLALNSSRYSFALSCISFKNLLRFSFLALEKAFEISSSVRWTSLIAFTCELDGDKESSIPCNSSISLLSLDNSLFNWANLTVVLSFWSNKPRMSLNWASSTLSGILPAWINSLDFSSVISRISSLIALRSFVSLETSSIRSLMSPAIADILDSSVPLNWILKLCNSSM